MDSHRPLGSEPQHHTADARVLAQKVVPAAATSSTSAIPTARAVAPNWSPQHWSSPRITAHVDRQPAATAVTGPSLALIGWGK
jgi:hypothetical protein